MFVETTKINTMSTKSDLLKSTHPVRVYEETNEPQHTILGKFAGYNVHIHIARDKLQGFDTDKEGIAFELTEKSEIGLTIRIVVYCIEDFTMDEEHLSIVLKGGDYHTEKFIEEYLKN